MRKRRKFKDVSAMKVMPAQCKTCPFGPNGDPRTAEAVLQDVVLPMSGSQICHHPALSGKKETHLCRGARDIQLRLLCAFGALSEPTDEAFEKKASRVNPKTGTAEKNRPSAVPCCTQMAEKQLSQESGNTLNTGK